MKRTGLARFRRRSITFLLLGAAAGSGPAHAAYSDDIGLTLLQAELGAATPNGAGVVVTQTEAAADVGGQLAWMPNVGDSQFAGKTIINASGAPAGLYSSHATSVGRSFYGNSNSIAPAITTISAYWADHWIEGGYMQAFTSSQPDAATSRIANHSWIGSSSTAVNDPLERTDWIVETDEFVQITALSNGPNNQPLLGGAYNVIAPGRSDGNHGSGTPAVDAVYTAGRQRPDVVIPAGSTSTAAPRTAAAVALLIQTGHGNTALSTDPTVTSSTNRAGVVIWNAERSEVLKAALMAGADRLTRNSTTTNIGNYRLNMSDQTVNGLDRRYGAGQVNIRNSYWIVAGGEQNSDEDVSGAAGNVSDRGFDYDPFFGGASGTNSQATYYLPVPAQPVLLTASLVWNLDIAGGTPNNFDGTATLRNLDLAVLDVANAMSVVASSQSTSENTENLWRVLPAGGQYALRVSRAAGAASFNWDYGLAWQVAADTDADGAHDGQDNCINVANGPFAPDAGGNRQLDANGDGYGNLCDGDLDNSGFVNAADLALFRAAFGTVNAAADLNGSGGAVNAADLAIFRARFGQAPGPSAYAP